MSEKKVLTTPQANDRSTPRAERIARRAYERFQLRGGAHGHDQEDWFEAEREIRESE